MSWMQRKANRPDIYTGRKTGRRVDSADFEQALYNKREKSALPFSPNGVKHRHQPAGPSEHLACQRQPRLGGFGHEVSGQELKYWSDPRSKALLSNPST